MLEQIYNSYRKKADFINWKEYDQNQLFYEYIKHENDDLAEYFFAGIVCRFWGYAGRVYVQCNRHVTFEECHDCVIDTIRYFNTLSIDGVHEEFNDATDGLLFNMESSEIDTVRIFISEFFEKGDILSGLLLDIICYNNYDKYDEKKIVKDIKSLTNDYFDYYHDYYGVTEDDFKKSLNTINKLSSKMLKMKLKSLLFYIRKEGLFNGN